MPARPKGTQRCTAHQRRYVAELLACMNGAEAARRANLGGDRPDRASYELQQLPHIKRAIAAGEKKLLAAANANAVQIVRANAVIAAIDARDFYNERGQLKPMSEWTPAMGQQVASVETVRRNLPGVDGHTDEITKLKFWNKNQALELHFKHLRLLGTDLDRPQEAVPCFVMPEGTDVAVE